MVCHHSVFLSLSLCNNATMNLEKSVIVHEAVDSTSRPGQVGRHFGISTLFRPSVKIHYYVRDFLGPW